MSPWALFFIFIAVVMVVGPIMMFKPSKRMQALDSLRSGAIARGLHVRLSNYTSNSKTKQVAVYFGANPNAKEVADASSWTLLKRDTPHDIHFFKEWDWVDNSPSLSEAQKTALKGVLEELPSTVLGVEAQGKTTGVWWQEKQANSWGLNELQSTLKKLNNLLSLN